MATGHKQWTYGCIIGAVCILYYIYVSYHPDSSMGQLELATHKDVKPIPKIRSPIPFIYKRPTEGSIVSLGSGCVDCNKTCQYKVETNLTSCRGDLCLCLKSNPTLYSPDYFDNSLISKQDFHPLEITSWFDKPTKNAQYLPNANSSKLTFTSGTNTGRVGERVELLLQLYDGFGKPMTRGGDDVRVRVHEAKKKMATSGHVKDLQNGSYVITIPTLWSGSNNVTIYIPFFREERAIFFRWLRQSNAVFYYKGVFSKGKHIQTTLCSPRPNIPGYSAICNLTYENGGNSWYCGAPPSEKLTCLDLHEMRDYHITELKVAEGEKFITRTGDTFRVFKTVQVKVEGEDKLISNRHKLPTCRLLPPVQTWQLDSPSGFVKDGVYFPTKCRVNVTDAQMSACLNDVTLLLTGDSTTRQWYLKLMKMFACDLVQKKQKVWQEDSSCTNTTNKVKIRWVPNTMPFSYVGRRQGESRVRALSISSLIDNIPAEGKYILVIHIYSHSSRHHYYVLQDKYRKLVPSLKRAFQRNKNLIVLVKGPHMFNTGQNPAFHDYIGPILTDILKTELSAYLKNIVYLDYWDMSMAYENKQQHPPEIMVRSMLRLLFAHSCPVSK